MGGITYPPHNWNGSYDPLYSINPSTWQLTKYPLVSERGQSGISVGGTNSARMIHKESNQLIIGPYFIKNDGSVRKITPDKMPGRLTGVARHLTDPSNKVYFYTMEQGLYEVNVNDLSVRQLHIDANKEAGRLSNHILSPIAPGAHGKSAYSGQGRLIIANNGIDPGKPVPPGGGLAEWDGSGDPGSASSWRVIENNKFTDITGPGGIEGSPSSNSPVWAIGWDNKSNILKLLDQGSWYTYRLPKSTHTFDDYHGWLTEWPRIHKLNNNSYIMDMFGMFYSFPGVLARIIQRGKFRFPKQDLFENTYSAAEKPRIVKLVAVDRYLMNLAGTLYELPYPESGGVGNIKPISTHNKLIYDMASWRGLLVLSGNLTSAANDGHFVKSEDGKTGLWFGSIDDLWKLGSPRGVGGPWANTQVIANQPSDPYLMAGYDSKTLQITHNSQSNVSFTVEVDLTGKGDWQVYNKEPFVVLPKQTFIHKFPDGFSAQWVRLKASSAATVTAKFIYSSGKDAFNEGFCSATGWEAREDLPTPGQSYNSYSHAVLPDGRLKQAVLGNDGKTLYARYLTWNQSSKSWGNPTNWESTAEGWPDHNGAYLSFDEVTFPDKRLKQTFLSSDGKNLYWRYLTWDQSSKKWSSIGKWENRGSKDLPSSMDSYASFDHIVLSDNRIKQTALLSNGKTIYYRYLSWNDQSKYWDNLTQWYSQSLDSADSNQRYRGFDSVVFPDSRLKETLISADGKNLSWHYWTACSGSGAPSSGSGSVSTQTTEEYTTSYQVAYDSRPTNETEWGAEQVYAENIKVTHTFSSIPGDKFIFVRFKTNKGNTAVKQLKVVLVASPAPSATVIPTTVSTQAPATQISCNRCSVINAYQRTEFNSEDLTCKRPWPASNPVTRTCDCSCPSAGLDASWNSSCAATCAQ
ncbi:hypothetical protein HY383_01625 [Candidatus Daviesbacteria bacterium]|nr:hypothetical protein [Candidatus Daviesbacteria bacterium]